MIAAALVERDAATARAIVDVLRHVPDRALAEAYQTLPSDVHDAVVAEARRRVDLQRAEREALQPGGHP